MSHEPRKPPTLPRHDDQTVRSAASTSRRSSASGSVQSLDRAVAILKTFASPRQAHTLTAIAKHTDISPSTVHRLLATLGTHGFIKQLSDRRYALGDGLLRIAGSVHDWSRLKRIAQGVLDGLRVETGETAGLHVRLTDDQRAVIAQAESREPLRRIYTELGEPIPIHQGSPGKVLLAYLPEAAREDVLGRGLEAATGRTITNPHELRLDLERIRRDGFSISYGERVNDIRTVAAPVYDYTGGVIASLSVTGPAVRMTDDRLRAYAELTRLAALELSASLGFDARDAGGHEYPPARTRGTRSEP